MLEAHPDVARWARHEVDTTQSEGTRAGIAETLADYLFERCLELLSQPAMRVLLARVPSLAIWDDHDILRRLGLASAA